MKQITEAPLSRLRNEQHENLMTAVDRMIQQETVAKLKLETLYPSFSKALSGEHSAMVVAQGSNSTIEMNTLDEEREQYYSGYNFLIESGLRHPRQECREAAAHLKKLVSQFGNVREKTEAEETNAIRNLVAAHASEPNKSDLATIAGAEWITALNTVNEKYDQLFNSRNVELQQKPSANVREARQEVDASYKAIVRRVNALAELSETDTMYDNFIDGLNGDIENLNRTLAYQKAAGKKATTDLSK
ncbi:MAG: hypothetical protein H6Q17_358 [Bacteroidetes bacterium]|nr:hypothetical protein [Bacteroidota bacterium]